MLTAVLLIVAAGACAAALLLERLRRRDALALARWQVRARIGAALADGLAAGRPIGEVLRMLVPGHADWCMLHTVEDDQVRRTAIVHADPDMEQRMRTAFERWPFVADAPEGPARVIRLGKGTLFREFTPDKVEKQPEPEVLRTAGLGSCIMVPLKGRQGTVGALTMARRTPRSYDEDDLSWAQELADRIGLEVENRRLFSEARTLFEESVSANFVSTADGEILDCNQAFAGLLGFESAAAVVGTPARSLYADPADFERLVAEIRHQRLVTGFEILLRRRDGQFITVSANAVGRFTSRGEMAKISGFLLDRTAEKDLEQQLRLSQRLEAVGQLAGGIAHDFNNLLTVIIGCVDLLQADREQGLPDSEDALDQLAKAAQRAASLTQQLLAFSRKQVLQPRVLQMNEAVENVHSMLRRLTPASVELKLDLDPAIERVLVDPVQLDQVIINLVVNSVDAMPDGGHITLGTRSVDLTELDVKEYPWVVPGRYVALTVTDTGVGMDEATRARVFEPFFTTKPVGKGTGLGLSTVYGIVKQSGGYIWVSSAPGAGTSVKICLPAVTQKVPTA